MASHDKPPASEVTETIGLPTRAQRPDDPMPQIPDYRFLKVIGRGAFGTVWLAEETMAGLFRAIKILRPGGPTGSGPSDKKAAADRVERELAGIHAYQARAKDHPHLVRILMTGLCKLIEPGADGATGAAQTAGARIPSRTGKRTAKQAVYYVMEIADHAGGAQPHQPVDYEPLTLATHLHRAGRLPGEQVIRHGTALLDAIEHLHKAGLHHRDVKPANCLFIGSVLKLADMGLAASDSVSESVGTPGYLPPDGKPDDLYALGKVIYAMTTGQEAKEFPDWPADLDPASDRCLTPLRDLINRFCHPSAAKRVSTTRETRRHLAGLTSASRGIRTSRRKVVALVSLVAALGLAVGTWTATRWYEPEDPMQQVHGRPPYNGAEYAVIEEWQGTKYRLGRSHRPGERYTLPCYGTFVTFWDIQTRLEEGRLEVSGAFQIYQEQNPVQRDITNPSGSIHQVCLCVGDELRFLYHAQPGAKPGTYHDFGRRGMAGIPLSELAFTDNESLTVYLAVASCYTPTSAAEEYKLPDKRAALLKHAQVIAYVSRP